MFGFFFFLCAHQPAQGAYADWVKVTFRHKGFVRSPAFLRPDVLCHIC